MTERALRRAAQRKAAKIARKANAQLSTGPITPEGKAISSRNHTTHGLTAVPTENFKVLATENQSAYDQSLADYREEWLPQTATEHDLVTRLATHAWLRDRAVRLQNQILERVGEEIAVEQRKDFSLYLRYYNTHARAYSKALAELLRLHNFKIRQAIQSVAIQIRFESQKQKTELHTAKIELIQTRKEAIKQRNQPKPSRGAGPRPAADSQSARPTKGQHAFEPTAKP